MRTKKGFTIIEVSLVLGLAGLIFLTVFAILPGVMASERDSERRDDMIKLVNNLKNFQTNNNRGALPSLPNNATSAKITWEEASKATNATSWAGFYKEFLGGGFTDPNGSNYVLNIQTCAGATNPSEKCKHQNDVFTDWMESQDFDKSGFNVYVLLSATCDGSSAIKSANNRKVAVLYRLERANGVYCTNS